MKLIMEAFRKQMEEGRFGGPVIDVEVGQTVTHKQDPEKWGSGRVIDVNESDPNAGNQPTVTVRWESGKTLRHQPSLVEPTGDNRPQPDDDDQGIYAGYYTEEKLDEEDTFTDPDIAGGDEYEGLDKVKYMLGLLLGKMSSDPDAAKYTNHLDKILVMMQGVGLSEEQKLDEAAMSSDEARDKAIGTLKSLSKQVDDKQVTAFLTEVKKWIDWTL